MLWKKLFYIFPITLISGAIFLGLAISQPVFGSPGLSGEFYTDKLNPKTGEEFTITISGSTDDPKRTMWGLSFQEVKGEKYSFDCLTGEEKKESFNYNSKPEQWPASPISTCQHSWQFSKPGGTYIYSLGYVYDVLFKKDSLDLNMKPTLPDITITVVATPDEPPLTGKKICEGKYSYGDTPPQSASSWCGEGPFTFCNGNTSIYFECSGWPSNCNPNTAKQTFNDFVNCPRPDAPILLEPVNGQEAAINSSLLWERVEKPKNGEIEGYKWEISEITESPMGEEVAGKTIEFGNTMGGQTTAVPLPKGLGVGKYYFWTARAITSDGRESSNGQTGDGKLGRFKTTEAVAVKGTSIIDDTIDCKKTFNLVWPKSPLGTELTGCSDLSTLIKYLYEWLISLGGLAVFIVLVMAGFQYLTSAGDPGKMKEAMSRIRDAVVGLGLLLGSVLILNTINPQLTQLRIPPLDPQKAVLKLGDIGGDFDLEGKDCKSVSIFSSPASPEFKNRIGMPLTITKGAKDFGSAVNIKSIEMTGDCLLTLYQLKGGQFTDLKPPSIFTNTYKEIGGDINFLSYEVSNLK